MRQIGPGSPFFFVALPPRMKRLMVLHCGLASILLYILYRFGVFSFLGGSLPIWETNRADVLAHFPSVRGDASQLTWSHAVNSRASLRTAIQSGDHMIESDVILGRDGQPLMAHPPDLDSDLPFTLWLDSVKSLADKGKKLDFKEAAAVPPVLARMQSLGSGLRGPVIVNADVLRGPNSPSHARPLPPDIFIKHWHSLMPSALLSLGWTTEEGAESYSWPQVAAMAQEVRRGGVEMDGKVTFVVRASLLHPGAAIRLCWLLETTPDASITLFASPGEKGGRAGDLLLLRHLLPHSRVFHDLRPLPEGVKKEFRRSADRQQHLAAMFAETLASQGNIGRGWDILADARALTSPGETAVVVEGPRLVLVSRQEVTSRRSARMKATLFANNTCRVSVGLRGKQFIDNSVTTLDGIVSYVEMDSGRLALQSSGQRGAKQVEDQLEGVKTGPWAIRLTVDDDGSRVAFSAALLSGYDTAQVSVRSSKRLVLASTLNADSNSRPVLLLMCPDQTLSVVHDLSLIAT